ncbi:MAG TPA: hypothetical protein VHH34_04155 [Pseudonocardiaceae bacterium]|nr:hypothetical protein [Pseudonocardiaceae bacterium]
MSARRPPTWPVIPLALPAAVSIWAGWVGLGQLTGFGVVQLLPGIWDGLRINTAVTLPIGMEAYASYALYVWLHKGTPRRARDFARISSIAALTLGALGQVAYHLMAASGVAAAPWPITAAVACLPVGVLGMGATLAHLLTVDDQPTVADPRQSQHGASISVPADLREATVPQFRPAMSAPPVAPFARVGDHSGHRSTTPQPLVDHPSATVPTVPEPLGADLRQANRSEQVTSGGGQAGPVVDHPSATPRPPADREPDGRPVPSDDGSDSGTPVGPDDPMVDRVRAMVAQVRPPDRPPGRRTVARELAVSEYRAGQLLAQVTNHHHNGTARREGTR